MDLNFSDEQTMLRDSVDRFVGERYDFAARRRIAALPARVDPAIWSAMAEFGWLALPLPQAHGGLGGSAVDVGIVAEGLGRGLVLEPFVSSAVLCGRLIERAANAGQAAQWLPALASGATRLVFAHGEAGRALLADAVPATMATPAGDGWRLAGTKTLVYDAPAADAFVVSADAGGRTGLFVVARGTAGVVEQAFELVDGRRASSLTFNAVQLPAAARLGGAEATDARAVIDEAIDQATAAWCAEAVGCMAVLLDATVAYTKTRVQFGQPISTNQVLKHRMVDMAIQVEESRLMALRAALRCDAPEIKAGERARAVSGAKLKIVQGARYVGESAVQLHGAMGVTEELNIGAYLKHLLAFEMMWGTASDHLARSIALRSRGLKEQKHMDLEFTVEDEQFRAEVREFIRQHLPAASADRQARTTSVFPEPEVARDWQRALNARGWVAPGWPKEYGGTGWRPAQRYLFEYELAAAGTPTLTPLGLKMVGPVIIGFGTPEQKAFYLPRILSGEDYWCQGYSEPGSGSDLASLRTRAVRDGDHYVINGTKIWTTHAHHANRMFALVRTDDSGRKQDGITFVLIDMATPGITIRPIQTIGGEHEVNQVFFDDVRIPVTHRIGDEGKGWTYGKYLLEFERGGGLAASRLRRELAKLMAAAAEVGAVGAPVQLDDPLLQAEFIAVENDIDALEMTELKVMSALQTGQNPGAVSSLLKLRASEIKQAVTRLGLRVAGAEALIWEPRRPFYEIPADQPAAGGVPVSAKVMGLSSTYLNSRAQTIFGGSSEIQRDIMAKLMLGL